LRSICAWLFVGLAIRCLLLPLAIHADTLAVYYRIGQVQSGDLSMFGFHIQALPMALHLAWVELTGVGVPGFAWSTWDDVTIERVRSVVVAEFADPFSVWRVAVWKLPYVLCDLACAFALARLVGWRAFKRWMVHPIGLFIVLLMGKYEPMMLLPLLGAYLAWKRGRRELGFLLLGVAVAMRIYPIFLLLPLVLVHDKSARLRWEAIVLTAAPLALTLMACALHSVLAGLVLMVLARFGWSAYLAGRGTRVERYLVVATLTTLACFLPFVFRMLADPSFSAGPILGHATQLTEGRLALQGDDLLYIFFPAYGAVCLWAHRIAAGRGESRAASFDDLVDVGLVTALCFSALGTINPQYFIVVVVLGVLRLGKSRDGAAAYGLQCVGMFLYMAFFHDGAVTNWLFAPVTPGVVQDLAGPSAGLPAMFDQLGPVGLGHSIFLLGALWAIHEVLRSRRTPETGPVMAPGLALSLAAWPLALAVVLWLPFRGGVEVREDFVGLAETVVPSLTTGRPLDGLELTTGETRYESAGSEITAIELRPRPRLGPSPDPPGHDYKVRLVDEAAGWERERTGLLRIQPTAFQPGSDGVIRVPLEGAGLTADHDYRLAWDDFTPQVTPPLEGRVVRRYPAATLAAAAFDDLVQRYFRDTRAGRVFLGLTILCLGAAVFLALGRRGERPGLQ